MINYTAIHAWNSYTAVLSTNGQITTFKPTANTDAARGIALQNAVTAAQAGDVINIGVGSFFVTTRLVLKSGQTIILNGSTIYHTDDTIDMFYISNVTDVTIQGNGTLQGSGQADGTVHSENGINIVGSSLNIKIKGLTIINFKGQGIWVNNVWSGAPQYFGGGSITDCTFYYNRTGAQIDAEYWKVATAVCRYNTWGIRNTGGNLSMVNSSFSLNDYGFSMYNLAGNVGHGTVTGCQFNHNNVSAIHLVGLDIGMNFVGNTFFGQYPYAETDSTIYIESCRGVNITGGVLGIPMQIYLGGTFTGYNYIRGNFFYGSAGTATLHGTDIQKQHLIFELNNNMDSPTNPLDSGVYNSERLNMYRLDHSAVYTGGFDNLFARTTGTAEMRLISLPGIKTWLGITDGPYLPLTGGSLSGMLTSTMGNDARLFNSASATNGYQLMSMTNTGAGLVWGIEGTTPTIIAGVNNYSSSMATSTTTDLVFGTNQLKGLTLNGSTQKATFWTGLDLNSNKITSVADATLSTDALPFGQADGRYLQKSGGDLTGLVTSNQAEAIRIKNDVGAITFYNTAGTTRTGYLQSKTGDNFGIGAENGAYLNLSTNDTNRVIIGNNGNVIINNTVASDDLSHKIQVTGNGIFSSSLEANSFIKTGATGNDFLLGDGTTTSTIPYASLSGTVPTWNQNTTGSAGSVAGANITGSTLAPGVITSSLTDVGILNGVSVNGQIVSTVGGNSKIFSNSASGNGYRWSGISNSSGYIGLGIDSSAVAFIGNGTASASFVASMNTTDMELGSNQTAAVIINGITQKVKVLTGLDVNSNKITNVAAGTTTNDAVNFGQLSAIPALPAGADGQIISYYDGGVPIAIGRMSVQNAKIKFTPTTGGTVTLTNNFYNIINPSGTLATLTVTLPSSPSDGDRVLIKFTQAITAVTYSGGTVVDGIASPIAGNLVQLVYDSASASWY